MDKKRISAIIIILLFLVGSYGAYLFVNVPTDMASIEVKDATITTEVKKDDIKDNTVLIFYSSSCPHCEIVDAYLKTDKASLKVDVRKLKVDDPKTDKANIEIALEKIKECNLKDN
jgi:protein-disulfide isomerase